jgi:ribosomal protein S12 methylthiotransferase accessory factor
MDIEVEFPGGKRVDAKVGGFTVHTDQPIEDGGEGTAPTPSKLFLASLAACAGVNLVYSFEHRGLSPGIARMLMHVEYGDDKMIKKIITEVQLPPDFPEKHKAALIRAVDVCYVKKSILHAPEFVTTLTVKS